MYAEEKRRVDFSAREQTTCACMGYVGIFIRLGRSIGRTTSPGATSWTRRRVKVTEFQNFVVSRRRRALIVFDYAISTDLSTHFRPVDFSSSTHPASRKFIICRIGFHIHSYVPSICHDIVRLDRGLPDEIIRRQKSDVFDVLEKLIGEGLHSRFVGSRFVI